MMGGPALHLRSVPSRSILRALKHLAKPSRTPLGVIPAFEPESSLAAPVSALACNDRCRITQGRPA